MQQILPKNLILLAKACAKPLYLVGGAVRDYLAGFPLSKRIDLDICSPMPVDELMAIAKANGFSVKAIYRNTGTVKLADKQGNDYEYTCFRSDRYVRGVHTPVGVYFTDDIKKDARRRDFTANAVYYDIAADCFQDPLDGIPAIREKRLTTVAPAQKVFGEDGLRLMRLARQAAQLGFSPDGDCLLGAKQNAALIQDISPERIFTELKLLLSADKKYGVKDGHYRGLKLLHEIGVLGYIFPELAQGDKLSQRADFHNYDVLEHSFRAVLYAQEHVRLAALLHDIGKPLCMLRDGNAHAHPQEGKQLAICALERLKAPKKCTQDVAKLVALHMYDFNCKTGENKLRKFFVENYGILEDLLLIKQADFSACKDDLSPAPTCIKWRNLLTKMQTENAPLTLKALAVKGNELIELGIPKPKIAEVLHALLIHAACNPKDNQKERLCRMALRLARE